MSAPEWWVIALPALLVVAAIIGGLYANVKILHDIKKTQLDIQKSILELEKLRLDTDKSALEIQKLTGDLEDREHRIIKPTAVEVTRFTIPPTPPRPPRSGLQYRSSTSIVPALLIVVLTLLILGLVLPLLIAIMFR